MRGAIQYKDYLLISPLEKRLIEEFLNERMKIEGKHKYPVY